MRQTDGQADKQANRYTEKQTDRHADRHPPRLVHHGGLVKGLLLQDPDGLLAGYGGEDSEGGTQVQTLQSQVPPPGGREMVGWEGGGVRTDRSSLWRGVIMTDQSSFLRLGRVVSDRLPNCGQYLTRVWTPSGPLG